MWRPNQCVLSVLPWHVVHGVRATGTTLHNAHEIIKNTPFISSSNLHHFYHLWSVNPLNQHLVYICTIVAISSRPCLINLMELSDFTDEQFCTFWMWPFLRGKLHIHMYISVWRGLICTPCSIYTCWSHKQMHTQYFNAKRNLLQLGSSKFTAHALIFTSISSKF